MFKPADISAVIPLTRVLPILSVAAIGDSAQTLNSRANQFVVGQEYQGVVNAKTSDGEHVVSVDGKLLKMQLSPQTTAGQTLSLRFMQNEPTPTFYLLSNQSPSQDANTTISQTAHLLGNIIQQAEENGAATRYISPAIVTANPSHPHQVAQDLKQAVQNSGLFYEAHLADVVAGKRDIESMRVELQNVANAATNTTQNALPAQQLSVLENQRFTWHGEVWPGQTMDWDVYRKEEQGSHQASGHSVDERTKPIFSEMTLHLPELGKVSARIGVVDGRLQVNLLSEDAQTLATFKRERQHLLAAIAANGQQVDALTVARYE
jgi:hypothetical protein